MSKKTRIRPLPRKRYPYGKFVYSVEFFNTRDHLKRRRGERKMEIHIRALGDFPESDSTPINKTLKSNISGRYRKEHDWYADLLPVLERIWFEHYHDVLIFKMLHPELIRQIYKVKLLD